ncbi:hypothetical protein BH11ACT8_BH11ACT8_13210 [soil metagenome]
MAERSVGRSRRLGTVAGAGLATGALAAVAGNQAWVSVDDVGGGQVVGGSGIPLSTLADASAPPVTALALVLLATWGVVLVTRGRFRRAITWLGLLAAVGTVVFAVLVWVVAADDVRTTVSDPNLALSHTIWSYVGVVAALGAALFSVQAVRSVREWPEMGRRYDAPGAAPDAPPPDVPIEDRTNLDLWRAIDEGHDPTDQDAH